MKEHREHLEEVVAKCTAELKETEKKLKNEIVERKKVEDALRQAETHWQNTFDVIEDIVFIIDKDYNILHANKAMRNLVGGNSAIGYKCHNIIHGTDAPIPDCPSCRVFKTRKSILFERQEMHLDNQWFEFSAYPSMDSSGNILELIHILRNITDRKQAEEKLNAYRDHLEDLVKERTTELEDANVRLLELDRMKSMFIASMSHELRTPLNSIIGFTGIMLDGMSGELNPKQKDQLSRVHKSARHLLAMITNVIDISRIESGRITVYPEEFHLDELIREATDKMRKEVEDKGLTLNVDVEDDLKMNTDRKRLLQCILHLLGNAAKFTEVGGITITAQERNGDVEISVSDTGIGIPEEEMPKVFHAFERLESRLKIRAGGVGLGLYLMKKLATEVMKGAVEVESEEGKGSTFRLRMPKDITLAAKGEES